MVSKRKLYSYYLLTNPLTTIIPLTAFIVGSFVASGEQLLFGSLLYGGISLFILFISGCILDDIGDKEIDREFHPNHPLVTSDDSAQLSEKSAWALFFMLDVIGLSLAFVMIGIKFFLIMLLYPMLALLYSIKPRITDWGVVGNATFIGFSVSLPFFAGAILTDAISFQIIAGSVVLLVLGTGLDLSKDFVKYYEDRKTERKNILDLLGIDRGSKLIALSTFLPYALSPVMFVIFNLKISYLIFTYISCFLLMVLAGEMTVVTPAESKEAAEKMERKTKGMMLIAYGVLEMSLIAIAISIL